MGSRNLQHSLLVTNYDSSSSSEEEDNQGELELELQLDNELDNENENGTDNPTHNYSSTSQTKRPPPLPSSFHQLFTDKAKKRKTDDPIHHQGRVRANPHVQGNWATHVYISLTPPPELRHTINDLHSAMSSSTSPSTSSSPPRSQWHSMITGNASKDMTSLHVSLSKTVFLKVFQIDAFIRKLTSAIQSTILPNPKATLSAERLTLNTTTAPTTQKKRVFNTCLTHFSYYPNDDQTRLFLSANVGTGSPECLALTKSVDAVMADFGLPVFYDPPKFHASIAWTLMDSEDKDIDKIVNGPRTVDRFIQFEPAFRAHVYKIDKVECKIGNRYFAIPLSS